MNPPHPNNEDAGSSVSPSAEVPVHDPSPATEKLQRWGALRVRMAGQSADWSPSDGLLDKGSGIAAPASGAASPRKNMPLWLRRAAWVVAVIAVCGLTASISIYRHFSAEAAKYDVAHLERLGQGTRVADRNGKFVGTMFSQDRKFVKMADVPQRLIDALIATEDKRFYSHGGVDITAICRAMTVNLTRMSVRQGGSTITQQLARQSFELKGRTLQRKLLETFIAFRLEQAYTKSQILEFYLNQIYLGSSFYGVGAAARGFFGKEVKDLTLEEGALIVGIIKAPVSFSPYRSLSSAQRVRNATLDRMEALGKIDAATRDAAKARPVQVLAEDQRARRPEYLIAAVEREMETRRSGERPTQVTLTVDIALQAHVQEILKKHVQRVETMFASDEASSQAASSQPLQAAAVVLNNHTGEILAASGGRDYRTSPFDRALQGQRPAGTAFLPLTYAAVFSVSPEAATSWVLDGPLDNRRVMVGGMEGILGEWGEAAQRNVYEGQVSALYALFRGKTGAAVRLGYQAGVGSVKSTLEKCGFERLRDQPSLLLGSSAVRLIEMARAYAAIAMEGKVPPSAALVGSLERRNGAKVELPPEVGSFTAFTAPAATLVRGTMVAVMQRPEIQTVLRENGLGDQSLAGYGGTAYGFTDAWFIGSNQDVTCAVWLGYDAARSIGKGAWAVTTALPFWAEVMAGVANGGGKGWPIEEGASVLCLRSGAPPTRACLQSEDRMLVQAEQVQGNQTPVPCPVHDPVHTASAIGAQPIEVWKQAYTPPRVSSEKGSRSVTPTQPVLVGPDVYGALESASPSAGAAK